MTFLSGKMCGGLLLMTYNKAPRFLQCTNLSCAYSSYQHGNASACCSTGWRHGEIS